MANQTLKYGLFMIGGALLVGGGIAVGIVLGTKTDTSSQNSVPVNLEVATTSITSVIESSATTETAITTAVTLVSSSAPTSVVTAQSASQTPAVKETEAQVRETVQETPQKQETAKQPETQLAQTKKTVQIQHGDSLSECYVAAKNGIKLRQEPNSGADVVCTVPCYETVTVYASDEDTGDWWVFGYKNSIGYATFDGLVENNDMLHGTGEEVRYISTSSGENVNLRERPSKDSTSLTKIPNGSTVTIGELIGEWRAIMYGGYCGFVKESFLTSEQPKSSASGNALYQILMNDYDMTTRGYISDFNSDGIKDMIIINPKDMNFLMYSCDSSGNVHQTYFGYYTSMSEVKLYDVTGQNAKHYFYWKCNYAYRSIQGYYDLPNNNEIDIGIAYEERSQWNADWVLWFNSAEINSGSETVKTFYGETPNCANALFSALKQYGFQITQSSKYKALECLDYDSLCSKIRS